MLQAPQLLMLCKGAVYGEARRERKGAKEEESPLRVEHTKSVDSSAFSLYHLAKFQP